MKAKYALMMVALSLVTLTSAQNAPQKATEILRSLSVPVQTPASSLEQRVSKMPNLALIPADASACFALLGVRDMSIDVVNKWLETTPDQNISQALKQEIKSHQDEGLLAWYGVNDLILAGDAQLAQGLSEIVPMVEHFIAAIAGTALRTLVSSHLTGANIDPNFWKEDNKKVLSEISRLSAEWMQKEKISPLLAIVSMKPNCLNHVRANLSSWIQMGISIGALKEYKLLYQGIEFSGFHLDGKSIAKEGREALNSGTAILHVSKETAEQLLDGMEKLNIYFLVGYKDDKMIISLSQDPKKFLKLAANSQESILSTEKLAFTDKASKVFCVGYADAVTSDALAILQQKVGQGILGAWDLTVEGISKALDMNVSEVIKVASKAVGDQCQGLFNMRKGARPTNLLVWWDKGVQVEMTAADCGSLAMSKPLKLASFADRPENMVYAAASWNPQYVSQLMGIYENSASAVFQFAEQILPEIMKINGTQGGSQILGIMSLLQMSKPELMKIWSATRQALGGMNSEGVLIIDNQGTMPLIPIPEESLQAHRMIIPRIAYAKGITDRRKVDSSWDVMQASLKELVGSYSPPESGDIVTSNIFGPKKIEAQGVSTYFYPSSFFSEGCTPCLSISDKAFVLGSSPRFNQEVAVAMAAPPSGSFEGAMFAFELAPFVKMLSNNVAALQPEASANVADLYFTVIDCFRGLYGTIKTEEGVTRWRLSAPLK